jgi:hypothetical protein
MEQLNNMLNALANLQKFENLAALCFVVAIALLIALLIRLNTVESRIADRLAQFERHPGVAPVVQPPPLRQMPVAARTGPFEGRR